MLGSDRNLPSFDLFDVQNSAVRLAIVGGVVKITAGQFAEPRWVYFGTQARDIGIADCPRFSLLQTHLGQFSLHVVGIGFLVRGHQHQIQVLMLGGKSGYAFQFLQSTRAIQGPEQQDEGFARPLGRDFGKAP